MPMAVGALEHAGPDTAPAGVEEVLRDPGAPLEPAVRLSMEAALGNSFGHVRVHADDKAAASAEALGAAAYTVGQRVVFGAGRFRPSSVQGRSLLAHELTHVVQQGGASRQGQIAVRQLPRLEAEAEVGAAALHGRSPRVAEVTRAPAQYLAAMPVTPLAAGGGYGGLMARDREHRRPGSASCSALESPTGDVAPLSFELNEAAPAH